jgi:hypothetical protein
MRPHPFGDTGRRWEKAAAFLESESLMRYLPKIPPVGRAF